VTAPFGRLLTAMVTPFTADGGLDLDGAAVLARHLLSTGHDGLVLSGTTGEAPTTTDEEKVLLLRAVREAVGSDVPLLAGVGTNDTQHSVHLARTAEEAGATGLLVVSPYYNRPPQEGLVAHVRTIADATGLPVVLYDIPVRTGVRFSSETLMRLAEHPRVVGVKDAKGDLQASAEVMAATDLAWYSGEDALTLPLLALGAVGTVGVITHLVGPQTLSMIEAWSKGDVEEALSLHRSMLPVIRAMFVTQGAITTKAALNALGLPSGPTRLPLVDLDADGLTALRAGLAQGGVTIP
jgi:4-hydroxy-tetrahydrodipicolinate synthase